jgi:hypothetical protein
VKNAHGKFEEANNLGTVNQSFQLGTGSWDYLLLPNMIKKKNLGLNSMLNYNIKTENAKKTNLKPIELRKHFILSLTLNDTASSCIGFMKCMKPTSNTVKSGKHCRRYTV